jgi:hypothetical protein
VKRSKEFATKNMRGKDLTAEATTKRTPATRRISISYERAAGKPPGQSHEPDLQIISGILLP